MKTSVSQRIIMLAKEKGFTENSFSKEIGIAQSTMNEYFKDGSKREPSLKVIQSIVNVFADVSVDWLLTGRGSMYSIPALSGNESESELELQAELTKRTIELEECKERLEEAYKTIEDLRYMVSLQKDKIRTLEGNMREEKKAV